MARKNRNAERPRRARARELRVPEKYAAAVKRPTLYEHPPALPGRGQ